MIFTFTPYSGLGALTFLMDRKDVRTFLGKPIKEFKKTPLSKNTTDDYGGFHVFYDTNNKVEAVEFFEDSNEVIFHDTNLLGKNFSQTMDIFSSSDTNLIIDNDGFRSNKFGVSIYAPDHKNNPDTLVESFLFHRQGYYD